ncbi:hypothetical protein H0A36_17640 [Endozoicomonas sp. SM1973]|uniref:Uncharacterized protein n=1 Tax=Spartinivicinus marinus TaxID=2994442 RepID=A0A853I1J2_9GAMM|nr:hypothetical protein [Spartinivicinus marinus]MCX4030197.1 hypothetical protein [Spartinivicinus marinus]NYZ67840.1 hypothetical protein [Spartinivicinus marinus]
MYFVELSGWIYFSGKLPSHQATLLKAIVTEVNQKLVEGSIDLSIDEHLVCIKGEGVVSDSQPLDLLVMALNLVKDDKSTINDIRPDQAFRQVDNEFRYERYIQLVPQTMKTMA